MSADPVLIWRTALLFVMFALGVVLFNDAVFLLSLRLSSKWERFASRRSKKNRQQAETFYEIDMSKME